MTDDITARTPITRTLRDRPLGIYPLVMHTPPNNEALQRLMREYAARVDAAFRLPPSAMPSPFMQTSLAEATAKMQVAMRRFADRIREVNGAASRTGRYMRLLSAAYAQVRAEERRKRHAEARRTMSRRAYRRWRGREREAGR